jgi:predicted DNA-binding transcriptional regulator YafY
MQSRKGCEISELTEMPGKSRRTVYRDLKEMEKAGLPCRFDTRQHCYVFDLREYFGYAWSLLREGQIYEVELRFCPRIAAEVAETQWHETQTAFFENDGSAVLKFRVDGLNEITWWILGYGNQVEVLAPRALRQRIAQIALKIADSQPL